MAIPDSTFVSKTIPLACFLLAWFEVEEDELPVLVEVEILIACARRVMKAKRSVSVAFQNLSCYLEIVSIHLSDFRFRETINTNRLPSPRCFQFHLFFRLDSCQRVANVKEG